LGWASGLSNPAQGGSGSDSGKPANDTLSQSSFESLIAQFGGTAAQADQLFSLLGGNETGTVSNAQMLKALGNTRSDPSSQTSQMLMTLMDKNGDASVSGGEFLQFETAMVNAERDTSV
jgi:Ca2+-binding EF-hand superfamily protein